MPLRFRSEDFHPVKSLFGRTGAQFTVMTERLTAMW